MNTYVPIFRGLQTCNGEYTKYCTRSRHQLKMAAPAEVSKRRSNFRIRQFKEKRHYNIATNLTFNTTVFFVTLLIACPARIACADRHTHTHTHKTTTVTLTAHARRGLTTLDERCLGEYTTRWNERGMQEVTMFNIFLSKSTTPETTRVSQDCLNHYKVALQSVSRQK